MHGRAAGESDRPTGPRAAFCSAGRARSRRLAGGREPGYPERSRRARAPGPWAGRGGEGRVVGGRTWAGRPRPPWPWSRWREAGMADHDVSTPPPLLLSLPQFPSQPDSLSSTSSAAGRRRRLSSLCAGGGKPGERLKRAFALSTNRHPARPVCPALRLPKNSCPVAFLSSCGTEIQTTIINNRSCNHLARLTAGSARTRQGSAERSGEGHGSGWGASISQTLQGPGGLWLQA